MADHLVPGNCEGAQLILSPGLNRGCEDSERDGTALSLSARGDMERDCGKCMESGRKSVMVLNSRDAGDPNCPRRSHPDSPVKRAIKYSDLPLIKSYAHDDLTKPDKTGLTPFHYACWNGCFEIVLFLSQVLSHWSLLATDCQGWTALHFACDAGTPQLKIIEYLLNVLKLNPRQETNKGTTPATLAKYRNSLNIVKCLTDIMCLLSPVDPEDQRPELVANEEDMYHSIQKNDHPNGDRNMSRLENRLFTFTMGSSNWPRAHPTERQLAEQGFVYTGIEERVFCFCCKAVIDYWDDGVDPLLKHYDVSKLCQFLWNNFRAPLERLLAQRRITHFNPDYTSNSARLHSFQAWRYSDVVSSFRLASAGFYYLGTGLQTRCFSCGLIHDRWRRGDIPVDVHRRRNPRCEFLRSLEREFPPVEPPPPAHVPHVPTHVPQASPHVPRVPLHVPHVPTPVPHAQVPTPVKPNYELLDNRIKSFKLLPKDVPVSGEDCAKAGLFFIRKPDVMQCFTCDAIVRGWITGDVPVEKHRAISPQCKFLREHFPTKLDQQGAYHNDSKLDRQGASYSKDRKQGALLPIDPSSLPEPEFTQEDLEKMSSKDKELASFSSLSLHHSNQFQAKPIQPSPQESQSSGYASNPTSYHSKPSSEYNSDTSLYTHGSSLSTTPATSQHPSFEPPVQRKPTANRKVCMCVCL